MKKILTVLILVLVLALSGCGEKTQDLKEGVYTQEEVDELISEVYQLLTEQYVMYDKENNVLISDCYIEDSVKQCDFILELEGE